MAGEFEQALGAGVLGGNLLAIPNTLEDQYQQAQRNRALLESPDIGQALGVPPQLLAQAFPTQPSGLASMAHSALQVPVLGQILKGIGGVGQILQMVTGSGGGGPAPRPPLEQLKDIAALRRTRLQEEQGQERLGMERERLDVEKGRLSETIRRDDTMAAYRNRIQSDKEKGGTAAGGPPKTQFQQNREAAIGELLIQGTFTGPDGKEHALGEPGKPMSREDFDRLDPAVKEMAIKGMMDKTVAVRKATEAREKREQAPLPAAAQARLADLRTLKDRANDLSTMLSDPKIQSQLGVAFGRMHQAAYNMGFASDPFLDQYQDLVNQVRILGTTPYMKGARNLVYIKQIQQHLVEMQNQPALAESKMVQVHALVDQLIKNVEESAIETKADVRAKLKGQTTNEQGSTQEKPAPAASPQAPVDDPVAAAKARLKAQGIDIP